MKIFQSSRQIVASGLKEKIDVLCLKTSAWQTENGLKSGAFDPRLEPSTLWRANFSVRISSGFDRWFRQFVWNRNPRPCKNMGHLESVTQGHYDNLNDRFNDTKSITGSLYRIYFSG